MNGSGKGRTPVGAAVIGLLTVLCLTGAAPGGGLAFAQEPTIQLSAPETDRNPFLKLLLKRESSRAFRSEPLPGAILSNLLWAAAGINRPESGKRTAPTANNRQEVDVYAATDKGLYLYDAQANVLKLILARDIRGMTGRQPFAKEAAVNLLYVADLAKSSASSEADRMLYAASAAGFISQNVYLYCASEGLATVVRASLDRAALAEVMKLRPAQRIILAQSVGYPKK
jgi:nitroreductase